MMTLAAYLEASELTQAAFAKTVGVSQPTVNRWLNGARPSWAKAAEIEKLTGGKVPVSVWAAHGAPPQEAAE